MADLKENEPSTPANGGASAAATPASAKKTKTAKKPKVAQARASKAATTSSSHTKTAAQPGKSRKVFSKDERRDLLEKISSLVAKGETVKTAVGKMKVSEQTYYHWKKMAAPASADANLKDLLTLEEENKRLKKLLAERLRKENAELRKKLGLK
jgi:putative transposase